MTTLIRMREQRRLKALEIDETLAEAHAALANLMYAYEGNFPEAEREFRRAIERTEAFDDAVSEHEKRFVLDGTPPEEAARKAAILREAYRKLGAKVTGENKSSCMKAGRHRGL